VLTVLRVFLGAMIFAHGFNKAFRGGRIGGTSTWFASIGMRPARLNALLAAATEMGAGALLVVGLLTSLASAAVVALMTVAIVTVHWRNGFFVFNKGQGIEYCLAVIVLSIAVATFGPGRISIDYALRRVRGFSWATHPSHGLLIAVVLGFGAALVQMALLYRPPRSPAP
jgi:putative oxidoreductase